MKAPKEVTIIADDRERQSGVVEHLREMDGVVVGMRRLKVGDYCAAERLLFERKTLKDFSISLIDGRLFTQAVKLANGGHKSVMILEGTGKDLTQAGVKRESLQGALITISLILGIPVLRSMSPHETARLIVYAVRQIAFIAKGGVSRSGYRPQSKSKKQRYILQGLPGIGSKRAERLLETFGSVEGVITASSEELASVEGIGKHVAEKIRWVVREGIGRYETGDELLVL